MPATSVLGALAGLVAVGGLLVAWRAPRGFAPLFLAAGVVGSAVVVIGGLVRDGVSGIFAALLAVPYWLTWMFLYMVFGAGRSTR